MPDLRDDRGLGVITVVLVMAIISSLTVVATALTISNLGNSSRDRQALAALATSEAGVAQAIQYLRGGNLSALSCEEPPPGVAPSGQCTNTANTNRWTRSNDPMQVRLDGTVGACTGTVDCFRVWIGRVSPFTPACPARVANPAAKCFATYRIHSTGVSGNGPSARRTAVDVKVAPYTFPLGVFAEQGFSGNGNVGIHSESIFTLGCMVNRQDDSKSGSGTQFEYDNAAGRTKIDLFYGRPAAAHAVGGISTKGSCSSDAVHTSASPCNDVFPFDQSGAGGPVASGSTCATKYPGAIGSPPTSRFTAQDMQDIGYRPRGLSDSEYSALKTQAQGQGTYNLAPGSISAALSAQVAAGIASPVLYWDNGSVSLKASDFPASFLRNLNNTANCAQNSVTIIVTGQSNNLFYQAGNTQPYLVAAIFVPDGTLTGQGGRNTIGTVYAKTVDLGGNVDFHLDSCFANNPPGGVLDVEVTGFREDDSTDVN